MEATTSSRHVLRDGTLITVRDITAEDAPGLREAFARLSPASRYRRFHRPMSALSDDDVRYLTVVDGEDHVALVALVESLDLKDERGVAVGRFIRLDAHPSSAEVAITVVDDLQGRGIGSVLLRALAVRARGVGIEQFHADMLAEHDVLGALSTRGARIVQGGSGIVDVELAVEPLLGAARPPSRRGLRARAMWR